MQDVGEICHARVADLVSNAADVQLRKMMIGWLLQGRTPSPISVMITVVSMVSENKAGYRSGSNQNH